MFLYSLNMFIDNLICQLSISYFVLSLLITWKCFSLNDIIARCEWKYKLNVGTNHYLLIQVWESDSALLSLI